MNKLILIGNLTADPQLRTTPNGVSVCDFTLAVNDRKGGENSTQFFRVTVWRQMGEACAKYLAKGRKAYVSGPVSARTYQTQNGETRVSLEVTADDVEFLSSRQEGGEQAHFAAPVAQKSGFTPVEPNDLPF